MRYEPSPLSCTGISLILRKLSLLTKIILVCVGLMVFLFLLGNASAEQEGEGTIAQANHIAKKRDQLTGRLKQIAGDAVAADNHDRAKNAFLAMGKLQAADSLTFLFQHIEYRIPREAWDDPNPEGFMLTKDVRPALAAIIELGPIVVPSLLNRVASTDARLTVFE